MRGGAAISGSCGGIRDECRATVGERLRGRLRGAGGRSAAAGASDRGDARRPDCRPPARRGNSRARGRRRDPRRRPLPDARAGRHAHPHAGRELLLGERPLPLCGQRRDHGAGNVGQRRVPALPRTSARGPHHRAPHDPGKPRHGRPPGTLRRPDPLRHHAVRSRAPGGSIPARRLRLHQGLQRPCGGRVPGPASTRCWRLRSIPSSTRWGWPKRPCPGAMFSPEPWTNRSWTRSPGGCAPAAPGTCPPSP